MATKKAVPTMEQFNVALDDLAKLDGWAELGATEQTIVRDETIKTAEALFELGNAKLRVGEHLYNVQAILEPKRIFTKFLVSLLHISRATAYRYIDLYKETKAILPTPVFQAAMLRADDKLNLRLVKASTPPRTTNLVKINEYLDSVQRGVRVEVTRTAEDVERMFFKAAETALKDLPKRSRVAILNHVIGAILTDLEMGEAITIKACAVPTTFKAVKGRPTKEAKVA